MKDMFEFFNCESLKQEVQDVVIAWRYLDPISSQLYRPAEVFKKFSFVHLLDESEKCACQKAKRLQNFLDDDTKAESSKFTASEVHVRTMDTQIIQNLHLRQAVSYGLNHIPLKPTSIAKCVATTLDAFDQMVHILKLEKLDFPVNEAREWIRQQALDILKKANRQNHYGFKYSGRDWIQLPEVQNEIRWITENLFCSGLDKAANNCCFICTKHIRFMALERLSSPDFIPCKDDSAWLLPTHIIDKICGDLSSILPEVTIQFYALPYIMATYKIHKKKYRWITNASRTVFSGLAHLLTIVTMLILESVQQWAAEMALCYKQFLQVDTSLFWLVNSATEVALNIPEKMADIFVADITRCFEAIPLDGSDNLPDAVANLIAIGFTQQKKLHKRATPLIWVRIDNNGLAAKACWNTTAPQQGNWFSLDQNRLIELHGWLMRNCFVSLGDRVWQQITGIPMGFACSPLWCNLYLIFYETQFIQRLARLGCRNVLAQFKHAYRYMDDLCWINSITPQKFLSPQQERTPDNPYWIYPLYILEIKCEVAKYATDDPERGIQAHFMNLDIMIYSSESQTSNFNFCKYDKRRDLPFAYTQYIKFWSNRPIKQSYAVAVSQTLPIIYLSSTVENAHREVQCLIRTLEGNGFKRPRPVTEIKKFLSNSNFPGIRFELNELLDQTQ